jgi:uncharacterized protein
MRLSSHVAKALSPRRLSLILFPTEKCNFRCTYCYEDFVFGQMAPEVIAGIKNLISKRAPDLDYLELGWFGGEPLLAKRVVVDVSKHANALAAEHSGLQYCGSMSTNGWLLKPDVLRELVSCGVINFQISLDGFGPGHDATRRSSRDTGTFDQIWNNLMEAKFSDIPFSISLRIHVSAANIDTVENLIEAICESFGGDDRFSAYIKPIERLGGSNDGSFPVLKGDSKSTQVDRLRDKFGGRLLLEDEDSDPVCYAAAANSFAIRSNGSIAKCTVALNDSRNSVGRLSKEGNLEINSEGLKPWLRGLASGDSSELRCPIRDMKHTQSS